MYNMRSSNGKDLSSTKTLKFGVNAKSVFILISVANVELAKTDASFLVVY